MDDHTKKKLDKIRGTKSEESILFLKNVEEFMVFKDGKPRSILDFEPEVLDKFLQEFWGVAEGEDSPENTSQTKTQFLDGVRRSLVIALAENNYPHCIITGEKFAKSRQAFERARLETGRIDKALEMMKKG